MSHTTNFIRPPSTREDTGVYQISETNGPLTPAEREAKLKRRLVRREHAKAYLDDEGARRRGEAVRGTHRTLSGEELVEAEHLAHQRIRSGEAAHRERLSRKCSSITDLVAATTLD